MGASASTANPYTQDYDILEQRSQKGIFSTYVVKDKKTKEEKMMKTVFVKDITPESVDKYKDGIFNICNLKLDNVVDTILTPAANDYLILIMPLYSKSLKSINPSIDLNEPNRLDIISRLGDCLRILHEKKIIHGNIKPSNILISEKDDYILSDYYKNLLGNGSSDITDYHYQSIEAIDNKELDSSCDCWSFGCLIYYLHTGTDPFKGDSMMEIYKNIQMYLYEEKESENEKINNYPHIKELLKKIFCKREERLSMIEILNKIKNIPRNKVSIHSNDNIEEEKSDNEENNENIIGLGMVVNNMGLERKIRKKLDELIRNCTTDLKMEDTAYGDQRLRYLCQCFPMFNLLESLILNSNGITDESIKDLHKQFKHLPNLKKFEISNNRISNNGMKMISKELSHISQLNELNICKNRIKSEGMIELSHNLSSIPNLKVLNVSSNDINDDGLIELSNNIKYTNQLTIFNCNDNNICDKGISYFSNHLKDIPEILCLEFSNNKINEIGAEEFSKNLNNITKLKQLRLNNNKIADLGLKSISDNLKFISELELLDLSNNSINDIGMINFSKEMKHLGNLTYINLCSNNISDEGFISLCNNLNVFTRLIQLNIGYNKIGNSGLNCLSDNLKYLRELGCIVLDGNEFDDDGLLRLCENFHYCDKLQYLFLRTSHISECMIGKIQSYKHLSVNYRL